jgi:Mn-containing catalase
MHGTGVFPGDPNGVPFTSAYIACTGDPIADLSEDMAADAATSDSLPTLKKSLNH